MYLSIIQAEQIIRLLLLNNFHPVISHRRVQPIKESGELLYTVLVTRYGPQSVKEALTSCAGMTCHARREFCPKVAIFPQFFLV